MDPTAERKIEIFEPFKAALDLTWLILFQPFDIGKWFIIGFAAFLSHLAGGGFNFNYRTSKPWNGNWHWNYRSFSDDFHPAGDLGGCWIPLAIGIGLLVLVIALVCLWVGSRGKFIFTDCIVRNRGAIVEPWHEYRREGNSYFLFMLVVGLSFLVVLGLAGIPVWLPFALHGNPPEGVAWIIALIVLGGVALAGVIAIAVPTSFMVPIMYRQRCSALAAFKSAISLITSAPGAVILYFLFLFVLAIAFGIFACLTTCLTCCITAIPYIGTVVLLPFYVFFAGYLLLFVRQFGPEYDAWANLLAAAPAAPATETLPIEPPPVASTEVPPTEPPIQS